MNNSRIFRIVLYAVLIFLAGVATGAFVAPNLGRHFMRPPRPEEMAHHMLTRLQAELHLTDDQATKIRPLIEATGRTMDTIRRETTQRVRAQMAETNAQIAQLLTPEQQIKFKQLEAEHRERMERARSLGRRPPPPGP